MTRGRAAARNRQLRGKPAKSSHQARRHAAGHRASPLRSLDRPFPHGRTICRDVQTSRWASTVANTRQGRAPVRLDASQSGSLCVAMIFRWRRPGQSLILCGSGKSRHRKAHCGAARDENAVPILGSHAHGWGITFCLVRHYLRGPDPADVPHPSPATATTTRQSGPAVMRQRQVARGPWPATHRSAR